MAKVRLEQFDDLNRTVFGKRRDGARPCESPGCKAMGEFRAPRSPRQLDTYYWFCLEHIREYNRAWNYYAGMSEDEVEAHTRNDTIWQRPTWPLGNRGERPNGRKETVVEDDFGVYEDTVRDKHNRRDDAYSHREPSSLRSDQARALATLDLDATADQVAIKARYKELVKRYHPDANGGDKAAEERLKIINEAYTNLKNGLAA